VRAVVCRELGPPDVLMIEEVADPAAAPGRVVIEVEAAGVNFVDALFVAGKYQIKPPLPFTPGSEIAGRIAAVGNGVADLADGDRVLASIGLGGFASVVSASGDQVHAIPDALDAPRAATFAQSYCTALFALRNRARLSSGQRVLVLGGGGGVGLAAIDVATWLGAEVIAAASSGEKRSAALEAGAVVALDSSVENISFRELAGWVDVVVDPVGGNHSAVALRALREGGRLVVIGFASGTIPMLPANQVLLRNREVIGVDWGAWAMSNPSEQSALITELLVAAGRRDLHPVSPTLYQLDDVAAALTALLGRQIAGKVALVP
jgi:NADPH2:quinone reductase